MKVWLNKLATTGRCLWTLRPHLRGGRYLITAVVGTSLVAALLEGVGVSLLVPLLSLLLGGEEATPMRPIRWMQEWLPGLAATTYIVLFCGLILAAIGAKNCVLYASQILTARMRRRMAVNLRQSLYQRLHGADLQLFEHHPAGELASIFLQECGRTISFIDYLLLFGQRASIGLFYIGLLLFISWQLTLGTIAVGAAITFIVRFIHRRLSSVGRTVVQLNKDLATTVLESFAGIRLIRATHSQEREAERFLDLNSRQAVAEEQASRSAFLIAPISETLAVAGAMTLVGTAYVLLVRPGHMLSSHLLGFGFVLLRLLPLLNQLHGLQGNLAFLGEGVRAIERWLAAPQYPDRSFGKAEFTTVRKSIRLEDVSYQYANGAHALRNVNLQIPAGKVTALVGPSGSGKSTLVALLLRFRQPTSGRVLVDGQDSWEFSPTSWHQKIAVVEQEAFLFHDTMARNVAYGCEEPRPEQIRRAIEAAQLQDLVESLPQGLDTVVGERGTLLSGGQRQRLALARALLSDPAVLLLDEPTSALDSLTESRVQAALRSAMEGRTVLVIAHRLSTIQNADQIVVLCEGQVAETGTWDELVRGGKIFRTLLAAAQPPPTHG